MVSGDVLTRSMHPREGPAKEFWWKERRVVDVAFLASEQKRRAAPKADAPAPVPGTHTMPLPHLSHCGILCTPPAPGALVTGALTLRVPEGRSSEKQRGAFYGKGSAGCRRPWRLF